MTKDKTEAIFKRFKFFHPEKSIKESLMAFGLECQDGWYKLIYKLCEDLEKLNQPAEFEIIQIKEKFGSLRVYAHNAALGSEDLIIEAELASLTICEYCGKPDSCERNIRSWLITLCDGCYASRQETKKVSN